MRLRGRARTLLNSVGLVALGVGAVTAALPTRAQGSGRELPSERTARDTMFAVPMVYNQDVLGDVLVRIPANGAVSYEAQSLTRELETLLNDAGRARLQEAVGAREFVDELSLASAGFRVRFDYNRLEIVLEGVEGDFRPVGSLGVARNGEDTSPLAIVEPANVSGFLNINGNLDYDDIDGVQKPEFYLFGATRFGKVALELDGAFSEQLGDDGYRFRRRSVRAIYDMPDKYMRVTAGDVRPETVPLLRTPVIGGVSVERRRRTFRPFLPASRLGGREIFLDTNSTVDVLINGVEYQTVELDAGRYDLANLPLQFGSNNVVLRVRDAAGREQLIDFDYFFEPLELEAGDYEYVASVGFLSRELAFEPSYSNELAAIGYFRKALNETFILGGALQLTDRRQVLSVDTTIVPQAVPGVIDFQGAVSTGGRTGYAMRAGYRWRGGGDLESRRQVNVTVDYQSSDFQTLDGIFAPTLSTLNVNASVTQAFSLTTFGTAGLSYIRQGGRSDQTLAYAEIAHRFNDRFRLVAGVEYGDDPIYRRNIGVRLGLSMLFGGRHRGNADYRSRTETFRAAMSRGAENHVGSWGYDLGVADSRGDTSANASVDYVGNRFDARATVFTRGRGFDGLADRQRARLQMGTSIAFADGLFGIGRPISDAFAVLRPHTAIEDHDVITGRSLQNNQYEARSGVWGAAVQPNIASYSPQNIQYDLAGLGTGFDLGAGLVRVDPPLHAGYKVVVGNNRYVSAVGVLTVGNEPLGLVSGRLTSADDEGFETQPFFTNSAGRFGILGLAPGKTYLLKLSGDDRVIRIEVPEQNDGLYRVGTIELDKPSE